jgi:hypothetical protein
MPAEMPNGISFTVGSTAARWKAFPRVSLPGDEVDNRFTALLEAGSEDFRDEKVRFTVRLLLDGLRPR